MLKKKTNGLRRLKVTIKADAVRKFETAQIIRNTYRFNVRLLEGVKYRQDITDESIVMYLTGDKKIIKEIRTRIRWIIPNE